MTNPVRKEPSRKSRIGATSVNSRIDPQDLNRLLSLRHNDPHRILGIHNHGDTQTIRAFRPDAESVEVQIGKSRPKPMVSHSSGLFEFSFPKSEAVSYKLIVHEPGGFVRTLRDPYSFPPTIGELDLHLFGEGKHEEIYNRLGAHVTKIGRVSGVAFAVWAPHAAGVSVVGDFNNWDGRLHQMRMLGGSGVWEIFIPDLTPGMLYKFEIRGRRGLPFLKADPYAQLAEVPPNTSSIVYQSNYKFQDAKWMKSRAKSEPFRQPMSIYEVHFGSWRRKIEEDNRPFSYSEMAEALANYVTE